MSYLPQSKYGNCSQCPAKDVACRKVGKDLWCLDKCYRNKKAKEQIDKAKLKQQVRGLGQYQKSVSGLELPIWFSKRMEENEPVCQNCYSSNIELKSDTELSKQWKSCQAHLLPKRHFQSIATHELNGMVLGTGFSGLCHCHDDYDSSWEKASTMKIWKEVIRRFKILYPLITPSETKYIPDVLLKELSEEDIGWKDMELKLDNE